MGLAAREARATRSEARVSGSIIHVQNAYENVMIICHLAFGNHETKTRGFWGGFGDH